MQFKSNAGADFSGRYTQPPLGDGVYRFDMVYPLSDALDWYKRNGRLVDPSWIADEIARLSPNPNMPDWHNRISLDVGINFPTKKDIIDRAARRISEHHEDALIYSMYGVKPQPSRLYRPEKRRYRKSWLKLLYGMFRPRARYTMLAPIICAFLAVAGVSFVAGMLTTILLSL